MSSAEVLQTMINEHKGNDVRNEWVSLSELIYEWLIKTEVFTVETPVLLDFLFWMLFL